MEEDRDVWFTFITTKKNIIEEYADVCLSL